MNEMVMRVEKAIWNARRLNRDATMAMAIAAIEAMREPTPEMLAHVVRMPVNHSVPTKLMEAATAADRIMFRGIWMNLIDAALLPAALAATTEQSDEDVSDE